MTSNVRAVFAQIMGVPLETGCYLISLVREILVLRMGLKMASRKSGATSLENRVLPHWVGATSLGATSFGGDSH